MKNTLTVSFLAISLLFSCNQSKDCSLQGNWKSTSFTASEAIDLNGDGVFSSNLLLEDPCAEVKYTFQKNDTLKRSSKNKRTNCEWSEGKYNYTVNGGKIHFMVNGMEQSHTYKLENCKLSINGILGSGITEEGRKSFLINVEFERE